MLKIEAFDHVVINVQNVERSASWYENVLGMKRIIADPPGGGDPRVSLLFGRNKINIRPISATQDEWFTGTAPQPGSDDFCFLTTSPPDDVAAHFRQHDVEIVLGPVIKQGARGEIRSVYVRDPDGNLIEVSSYA